MASNDIVFGTDGWRGRIADDYTFGAVRRCAQGFAQYLRESEQDGQSVVVGYDMRFLSEDFAAAAAEVLAANGFHVLLTEGASPTPVIAHAIVTHGAAAGVNITASHNPPGDNGFKVRNRHGGAIAPAELRKIENTVPDSSRDIPVMALDAGITQGAIRRFDPAPDYIQHISGMVDLEGLKSAGLQVMVDAMWGNGAGWFPRLLQGGKTQVREIHNQRNPLFPEMIRPEPIPPNVDAGLRAAVEAGCDILIVTDGDADRLGVGDERGEFVDQLRVYGLLALYLLEVRGQRGPIVKTLSTTSMLNKLGELYGVPVYQTGVGFKYVAPKMLEVGAMIGGEESGGYAFAGHVPERDGILAGLYLLDMMHKTGRKPSQLLEMLFEKVGAHYYHRIDTALSPEDRPAKEAMIQQADPKQIGGLRVVGRDSTDGYKFELEDGGWLLIRFSGTEPIVRVYCETTSAERVDPILQDGLRVAGIE